MVGARLALDTLRRECRCRQRGRGKSDIKSDMLGHAVPLTSIGKRSGTMAKIVCVLARKARNKTPYIDLNLALL
jgi:hypothetical protein